jgi:hypothetical protein
MGYIQGSRAEQALDKALEDYPEIKESEHLGTVLIGYDFFIVSGGLAEYFPRAVPAD